MPYLALSLPTILLHGLRGLSPGHFDAIYNDDQKRGSNGEDPEKPGRLAADLLLQVSLEPDTNKVSDADAGIKDDRRIIWQKEGKAKEHQRHCDNCHIARNQQLFTSVQSVHPFKHALTPGPSAFLE